MKRIAPAVLILVLSIALPLTAQDEKESLGFTVGAEIAMESDFTVFGIGPWLDYYKSFGLLDAEAFLQWGPYLSPAGPGWLYAEADAYLNLTIADGLTLTPALSLQDTVLLDSADNSLAAEPSVKLDADVFFAKLALPIAVMPAFAFGGASLEPGVNLGGLKLKLRGDVSFEPFAFSKAKWYAEKGFGPVVVYAYGVLSGFEGPLSYSQYIGVSYAF